jgi:hypothetical protein
MAVGLPAKVSYVDGDVFSASDINDTNGTLNIVGQTNNFYAGKNKIINGDFAVWQRGTSFGPTSANGVYTADRWQYVPSGATSTVTRETFTAGAAPVAGYEGSFFARCTCTIADDNWGFLQPIENVRTLAGQTATLSFYAKADAAHTMSLLITQNFGGGGSASVNALNTTAAVSTAWTRYSYTFSVGSLTGKTIGTNSKLDVFIRINTNTTGTFDIWGVQLEAGSAATAFQTATGTIQGELAACQRYYQASATAIVYIPLNFGTGYRYGVQYPVTMRIAPTVGVTGYSGGGTQIVSEFISTTGFQTGANSPSSGPYFTQYTASAEL